QNSTSLGRGLLERENPRTELPGHQEVLTGADFLSRYLEPLSRCPALAPHLQKNLRVMAVGRKNRLKEERGVSTDQPFRLLLRGNDGKEKVEEADVVLDCTGVYGNRRPLGDGGIPAIGETEARSHIATGIEDMLGHRKSHYADKTTVVIGTGYSAATNVTLLARLAKQHTSTWTIWLGRSPGSQPLRRIMNDPFRERDLLASQANMLATRGEGNVEYHASTIVSSIESLGKEGLAVTALIHGTRRRWEVDRVIANTGPEPDPALYRELQIMECGITLAPLQTCPGVLPDAIRPFLGPWERSQSTASEPNYFVLGEKSHGRVPHFLMQVGHQQIQAVFAHLMRKSELNLYRQPSSFTG
ncbi:MAG: hypothetical protein ACKO23_08980, partial [Gemmataceae bacterium]